MRKMIEWSTPKEYQRNKNMKAPGNTPKPKSKWCKKLKGPHIYGEWERLYIMERPTGLWHSYCVACNKKKYWSAPTLKGTFWKSDLKAKPPKHEKD